MRFNLSSYLDDHACKVIRCFVIATLFIGAITLQGMADLRQAHRIIFMLAGVSLFSLILKNIWVTLFVLWSVFLFSFFKFSTGSVYLSNIFFGCVWYLIVKIAFEKKHINFFINGLLWFVAANVAYMAVQLSGYDFIYAKWAYVTFTGVLRYTVENRTPYGFMSHVSITSAMIAMAIPLLASRGGKIAWLGAVGLFVPLYILTTSLCFLAGGVGLLFVLYYRIPKKVFILLVAVLIACGFGYTKKVDGIGVERFVQWHQVMRDAMAHPVTGWGMDSFANITPQKEFRYAQYIKTLDLEVEGVMHKDSKSILWWGNPHNLYISLFYEFGVIGLFLFIGYIRQNVLRFARSLKEPNIIGLAGFILVFLAVSAGHFPIFLARMAVLIIPAFALFEISTEEKYGL